MRPRSGTQPNCVMSSNGLVRRRFNAFTCHLDAWLIKCLAAQHTASRRHFVTVTQCVSCCPSANTLAELLLASDYPTRRMQSRCFHALLAPA